MYRGVKKMDDERKREETKYAATYKLGKTTVYIVEPKVTPEQVEKIVHEMHMVGWRIVEKLRKQGKNV